MNTYERLTDVFRSVFNDGNIELDDAMTSEDIEGWDSVAHITLIFAIEEEFCITFSTADLDGLGSVGDLHIAISARLGPR